MEGSLAICIMSLKCFRLLGKRISLLGINSKNMLNSISHTKLFPRSLSWMSTQQTFMIAYWPIIGLTLMKIPKWTQLWKYLTWTRQFSLGLCILSFNDHDDRFWIYDWKKISILFHLLKVLPLLKDTKVDICF